MRCGSASRMGAASGTLLPYMERMSSLATGLRLLDLLRSPEQRLSVSAAAGALGLPKSTVSRALRDLAAAGMLEREADGRAYGVGQGLFRLGTLYKAGRLPVDEFDRDLRELTVRFPATGYVAVRRGADTVILRVREGFHPVRVGQREGAVLPAWTTAIGKALLAELDDAGLRALLPPRLASAELGVAATRAELLAELAACRARGYAELNDRLPRGIDALAVAVTPARGEAVACALCWMADTVDAAVRARMVGALLAARARIAASIG